MGEYHRRRLTLSAALIVPGGRGQIHKHPEPVHLADDAVAERCQPLVLRGVESRVGPIESHVVRERHVADAEIVVRAQRAE
jgi:hypothetical protein